MKSVFDTRDAYDVVATKYLTILFHYFFLFFKIRSFTFLFYCQYMVMSHLVPFNQMFDFRYKYTIKEDLFKRYFTTVVQKTRCPYNGTRCLLY